MKLRYIRHFFWTGVCAGGLLPCLASAWAAGGEQEPVAPFAAGTISLVDAVILGVVEGATEYLPVSSTGHLLIAQRLLGIGETPSDAAAANSLAICIQAGAILAVLLLYRNRIQQMIQGLLGADPAGRKLLLQLLVAFAPAAVLGLLFHDLIKQWLFGIKPVAIALFTGGVLILLVARRSHLRGEEEGLELMALSWRGALLIGLLQCLAFWPGFSRSLATILGGLAAGLRLTAAVEFSFLLGLLTLTAATAFEAFDGGAAVVRSYGLLAPSVALVAAFLAAVASIKWMLAFLNRYGFALFGYYRIALAAILWWVLL